MIIPMQRRHVRQVAELHCQAINSLLGDLGSKICLRFYERAIQAPECIGFVDEEAAVVRGFALATTDNARLFAGARLRLTLALALLRKPRLIRRILFHLGTDWPAAAEILYEAVAEPYRRQGMATRLNEAIHEALRRRGIGQYELRIDKTNIANLMRHQKLGAEVVAEYTEAGIPRYLLVGKVRGGRPLPNGGMKTVTIPQIENGHGLAGVRQSLPIPQVRAMRSDDPAWDAWEAMEKVPIYRRKVWKELVEQTFGHRSEYIAAFQGKAGGAPIDIVPFFLVRDPFGHKALISTPYQGSSGGFQCSDSGVRRLIIERAIERGRELGARFIEVRAAERIADLEQAGFIVQNPLLTTFIPVVGEEQNWARLSSNHRRNVRMAVKHGVVIEPARTWEEMREVFRLLSAHYKSLGVPFFGEDFFRQIWDMIIMRGHGTVHIARRQGDFLGGHILFFNGDTLVSKYAACLRHGHLAHLNASYALFWESIRLANQMDLARIDLGITGEHNEGLRDFKLRLGGEESPLHFYYYRITGKIPDYGKLYGSYGWIKKIWKWTPKPITDWTGRWINRWIC